MKNLARRSFLKAAPMALSLLPTMLIPKAVQAKIDAIHVEALKAWLNDFAERHECHGWQFTLTDYGLGRIQLFARVPYGQGFFERSEQFIYGVDPNDHTLEQIFKGHYQKAKS